MDASPAQPAGLAVTVRLRWLFLLVLVLFIWNAWHTAATGVEPYPTLLMPSFRGSPHQGGVIHVMRMEIEITFADGGRQRLAPSQLLPELPGAAVRGIMQHQFRDFPHRPPPPAGSDEPVLMRWLHRAAPGYWRGRLRRETWAGVDAEAGAWLWRRARAFSGGREVRSVAVDWSVELYAGREPDWVVTRTPLTRVEVPP